MESHEDSTSAQSESARPESTEPSNPPPDTAPDELRVHVPVSVTVFVPITIPAPETPLEESYADLAGLPVVDASENPDVIGAAMEAAIADEAVADALGSLVAGVQMHKRDYPSHRATFTAFRGLYEEQDI